MTSLIAPPPPPPSGPPPASPLPTSPRPGASPATVGRALAVGGASAVLVPNGPPGLGLLLVAVTAGGVVALAAPAGLRCFRGWRAVHAATAVVLLSSLVLRDAAWLVLLDLLAATALASLALVPAGGWAAVLSGGAALWGRLPAAAAWLVRGGGRAAASGRPAGHVVRGTALAAALLMVFVPLLSSADPAFADLLAALVPDLPPAVPGRTLTLAVAAVVVAAALSVLQRPRAAPVVPAPTRTLERTTEWLLPLLALDLLLGAFVVVQGTALLGGDEHVLLSTRVTYASYARQGFWQLLVVTALVLGVVAAAVRWAPRAARPLLAALCGLALLVDLSALRRLDLYADAYGLTRLRLLVTTVVVWLAVVLVLVLVAGRRPGRWLPHAVVLSGALALAGLTALDPDARIAQSALDRGGRADVAYLDGLSDDALPVLARFPEPLRCRLLDRVADDVPWTSASFPRARAREVLVATGCPG